MRLLSTESDTARSTNRDQCSLGGIAQKTDIKAYEAWDRDQESSTDLASRLGISKARRGRVYYNRKQAEGKTKKEALRALKRRISTVVYQGLIADQQS